MHSDTPLEIVPLHFLPLVLVLVTVTELQRQKITHLAICVVLALAFVRALLWPSGLAVALTGAAGCGVPVLTTAVLRPGTVGAGDWKLATALGALLGPAAGMASLLAACLLALLLHLLTSPGPSYEAGVPFGPFLVAGAITVCVSPLYF
jgi:leader peptidase (prepilin peptidase)/N-methyltransferase